MPFAFTGRATRNFLGLLVLMHFGLFADRVNLGHRRTGDGRILPVCLLQERHRRCGKPRPRPQAPRCWNRTPIGAAAVPVPTPILTAKFRRGGPALGTTGSSQDNSRLLRFLNGFCL